MNAMRLFWTALVVAFATLPADSQTVVTTPGVATGDGAQTKPSQGSTDYSVEFGSSIDNGGTVQQVVRETDIVVVARATSSAMRYGAPMDLELLPSWWRMIFRDYAFEPLQVIKGAIAAGDNLTVPLTGGRSVNSVALPLGEPTFIDGRHYVLFMCPSPLGDGYWLTRGLSSAFDVTDTRVTPLGNSVSARSQRNASTERFLQRVSSAAKQQNTKKQSGYACGW